MQNVCDTLKKRPKCSDATWHHSAFFGSDGSGCEPERRCQRMWQGTLFDFQNCKIIDVERCAKNDSCQQNGSYAAKKGAQKSGGGCCQRGSKVSYFRQ